MSFNIRGWLSPYVTLVLIALVLAYVWWRMGGGAPPDAEAKRADVRLFPSERVHKENVVQDSAVA